MALIHIKSVLLISILTSSSSSTMNSNTTTTSTHLKTRSHWYDAYKLWLQRYEEAVKLYEEQRGFRPPAQSADGHRSSAFYFSPAVSDNHSSDFVYHIRGPGLAGSLVRVPNNGGGVDVKEKLSTMKDLVFTPAWVHDLAVTTVGNNVKSDPVLHASALKCPRVKGELTLMCSVEAPVEFLTNLTMTWKKISSSGDSAAHQSKLLAENSSIRGKDSRLSLERTKSMLKLRLWNFTLDDAGLYRCEGLNNDVVLTKDVNVRMCKIMF